MPSTSPAAVKLPGKPKPAHGLVPNFVTPTGLQVKGTVERIPGTARTEGLKVDGQGKVEPIYGGGTDVCWDGQVTVVQDGHRLWVDEDGDEWPENKLKVRYFKPEELA